VLASNLEVSQLGECVHDDTEYDVEADARDEDEECYVEDDKEAKPPECVLLWVTHNVLQTRNRQTDTFVMRY